jgi:hypothetical protein
LHTYVKILDAPISIVRKIHADWCFVFLEDYPDAFGLHLPKWSVKMTGIDFAKIIVKGGGLYG